MGEKPVVDVLVKIFGGPRRQLPSGPLHVLLEAPATFGDLLDALEREEPVLHQTLSKGLDAGYLNALINGRNIQFLGKTEAPLHDRDTIAFLPPVGGG